MVKSGLQSLLEGLVNNFSLPNSLGVVDISEVMLYDQVIIKFGQFKVTKLSVIFCNNDSGMTVVANNGLPYKILDQGLGVFASSLTLINFVK